MKVNINGTWKDSNTSFVNINGIWKSIQNVWINNNGIWKSINAIKEFVSGSIYVKDTSTITEDYTMYQTFEDMNDSDYLTVKGTYDTSGNYTGFKFYCLTFTGDASIASFVDTGHGYNADDYRMFNIVRVADNRFIYVYQHQPIAQDQEIYIKLCTFNPATKAITVNRTLTISDHYGEYVSGMGYNNGYLQLALWYSHPVNKNTKHLIAVDLVANTLTLTSTQSQDSISRGTILIQDIKPFGNRVTYTNNSSGIYVRVADTVFASSKSVAIPTNTDGSITMNFRSGVVNDKYILASNTVNGINYLFLIKYENDILSIVQQIELSTLGVNSSLDGILGLPDDFACLTYGVYSYNSVLVKVENDTVTLAKAGLSSGLISNAVPHCLRQASNSFIISGGYSSYAKQFGVRKVQYS